VVVKGSRAGASDADRAISSMLAAAYRTMTPQEKIRQVLECNAVRDAMALVRLGGHHPGASERELRLHLAAERLGRPLMIAAFGWDPEQPETG
jgi:hypothetical protein